MFYSEEIIEEVRSRSDILTVVGQYVRLTRRGSSYFGLCPFHNEKTPSFSVTPSKQMYYCFGCGNGGGVFQFLMQYENISFSEAVQVLAERAGVTLPRIEYSSQAREMAQKRDQLLEIQKQAAKFYYYHLKSEAGKAGLAYLQGRQLSPEIIRHFGLGYAPKAGNMLHQYMKQQGYTDELLMEAGLFGYDDRRGMYDRFRDRVMYPIMDVSSRVIGFGGRVLGDGEPKYLNSPETMIFDKGRNLYGLHIAKTSRQQSMLLCEGYMDVISMHQAGFTNAVASLGTAFTSGHASLLKRYASKALLLYDSDDAGVRAALRAIPILKESGIETRVVSLKPCKDPDEFIKTYGKEAFQERLDQARDSFLFRIDQEARKSSLDDPQGQNAFFDRCSSLLIELEDELERNLYIDAIVKEYQQFSVTAKDLRRRVNTLALKGQSSISAKERAQSVQISEAKTPENKTGKSDSADRQAQRFLLTQLASNPWMLEPLTTYIKEEDFIDPLYREVAGLLFEQCRLNDVQPAKIINHFAQTEEQFHVAEIFHSTLVLENEEQLYIALADSVCLLLQEKLDGKQKEAASSDLALQQNLLTERVKLQNLKKNKQKIRLDFARAKAQANSLST